MCPLIPLGIPVPGYLFIPPAGEPATVYLHAAAWEILEMAKAEYDRRNPAEE
jgi:PHD/YefM family antitoxin component YafN of YafNO toxin-antitoxin module